MKGNEDVLIWFSFQATIQGKRLIPSRSIYYLFMLHRIYKIW